VLEIEDLGSRNGTRLRGNLLQPGQRAPVLPGEAISIGWATLMIQRRRPTVRVRRIPTHAYFEGRLEEECDKAVDVGARVRGAAAARRARDVEPRRWRDRHA
jgi:hypothetical protein